MRGKHCKKPRATAFAIATGMAVILGSPAGQAQTRNPDALPPSPAVKLSEEQAHVIKEIILKEMKTPEEPKQVPTQVGETVPPGVPVQPIPVEVASKVPQVRTHGYLVKQDQVIVVDPKNKKVAAVIR
jgi:hypothetical protein